MSAKIVATGHVQPASASAVGDGTSTVKNAVQAAFKVDTVVKDTTEIGMVSFSRSRAASNTYSNSIGYGTMGDGRFDVMGLSLVGNSSKKVTIENSLDDGDAIATFNGWIEDT